MAASTIVSVVSDAYISSACPKSNYGSLIINKIGRKNRYSAFRMLLKFDISAVPKDAEILSAKLKLYIACVQDASISEGFTPYMLKSIWKENSVTWINCPDYDVGIYGSTEHIDKAGWYIWDISDIVKKWYNNDYENHGILIKADEAIEDSCKSVISSKNTKSTYIKFRPALQIDYDYSKVGTNVKLTGRQFNEHMIKVVSSDKPSYTPGFNISQKSLVSFFVKNTGENKAKISLQISPDDLDYIDINNPYEIEPGSIKVLFPSIYSKYARICYLSLSESHPTALNITLQTQV